MAWEDILNQTRIMYEGIAEDLKELETKVKKKRELMCVSCFDKAIEEVYQKSFGISEALSLSSYYKGRAEHARCLSSLLSFAPASFTAPLSSSANSQLNCSANRFSVPDVESKSETTLSLPLDTPTVKSDSEVETTLYVENDRQNDFEGIDSQVLRLPFSCSPIKKIRKSVSVRSDEGQGQIVVSSSENERETKNTRKETRCSRFRSSPNTKRSRKRIKSRRVDSSNVNKKYAAMKKRPCRLSDDDDDSDRSLSDAKAKAARPSTSKTPSPFTSELSEEENLEIRYRLRRRTEDASPRRILTRSQKPALIRPRGTSTCLSKLPALSKELFMKKDIFDHELESVEESVDTEEENAEYNDVVGTAPRIVVGSNQLLVDPAFEKQFANERSKISLSDTKPELEENLVEKGPSGGTKEKSWSTHFIDTKQESTECPLKDLRYRFVDKKKIHSVDREEEKCNSAAEKFVEMPICIKTENLTLETKRNNIHIDPENLEDRARLAKENITELNYDINSQKSEVVTEDIKPIMRVDNPKEKLNAKEIKNIEGESASASPNQVKNNENFSNEKNEIRESSPVAESEIETVDLISHKLEKDIELFDNPTEKSSLVVENLLSAVNPNYCVGKRETNYNKEQSRSRNSHKEDHYYKKKNETRQADFSRKNNVKGDKDAPFRREYVRGSSHGHGYLSVSKNSVESRQSRNSCILCITGWSSRIVTLRQVWQYFDRFGIVIDCWIEDSKFFLKYSRSKEASIALSRTNDQFLFGRRIRVRFVDF